jgi:hypothetical protein
MSFKYPTFAFSKARGAKINAKKAAPIESAKPKKRLPTFG